MIFQKITLSNNSSKNAYYNYVNTSAQLISQKLIEPNSKQTIWIVAGSLNVVSGFAQFIVEDEVEGIIPAAPECNATFCLSNCCQYRITATSGLRSWRYIDCEGTENSGILNGGQSITICASFFDSIVAAGCEILLLGCCPQFPPQTPSNTPTATMTPTPIVELPTFTYQGLCGTVIDSYMVGAASTQSQCEITFEIGTYTGPIVLNFNSFGSTRAKISDSRPML